MCIFSAPKPPAVVEQPLPDPDTGEQEKARKDALSAANKRKGFGSTGLSEGNLGSSADATIKRPTLLGQSGAA